MSGLSLSALVQDFFFNKVLLLLVFPCGSALKNPPVMWETWVRSLGWEDPQEKEKASIFWPGEFHGPYRPWGRKELLVVVVVSL